MPTFRPLPHARAAPCAGNEEPAAGGGEKFPVLYRFNEGYTNAVKRPMTVADWL